MTLGLILTLAGKDWRLFWADRRAAALCFLVPVILASAFGVLFDRPTASGGVKLPLLVVVEADTPTSRRLADAILRSPRADGELVSREEADRRVADGRPGVAIVVPADIEALAKWVPGSPAASKPRLVVLHHPLCAAEAQWAEGVATEAVMRQLAADALGPLGGADAIAPPFDTLPTPVGNGARFDSYAHSFSGMTIQYLLFWGMESGLLLLRERGRGVWQRVRAAPVPLTAILLGRALTTAGVAVLQIAVTFAVGRLVFGVRIDGWVGFTLIAAATAGLAAATGLLVATVGGTEARARSVCILVILGVSMLGGLWVPAFLLPDWARQVAQLVPTTWAMRGFDAATWQSRSAVGSAVAVGGFAVALLALAAWRFRRCEAAKRRGDG